MFFLFFLSNIATISALPEQESAASFRTGNAESRNSHGLSTVHLGHFSNPLTLNATYIDKADNLLRVPNKYYEENKTKKKVKKSPKRTVQKIIKKNKVKSRKLYLYPATILPTLTSKSVGIDENIYTANDDTHTTEVNIKKRPRKNPKYVRYPMPFQKLQSRKDLHNRYRRDDRDVYILKDLDEIEFLSSENGQDRIRAHIGKYW